MADPVGTAKQVVKIVLAIRTAVQTVRRNDEECREIEQLATRVSRILSQLQETESDPAMDGAMAGLEKSLDRALNLVTTCQKRSAMHRVLRGWGHGQAAAPGAGRHTAAIDAGCLRHHYPAHPKPEHATAAGCWCPSTEVPAAFLPWSR